MASDNVMSVEVAIKRELEYRRKMEALQFHLPSDFDESIVIHSQSHLQEPPSILGRKRKIPTSNLQIYPPPPQPQPSSSNFQPFLNYPTSLACKVCELNFSNPLYLKQHCMGPKHQMKLTRLRAIQKNGVQDPNVNNPYWCNFCQSGCSSAYTLGQHLIGRRHAAAVQAVQDGQPKNVTTTETESGDVGRESVEWQTAS